MHAPSSYRASSPPNPPHTLPHLPEDLPSVNTTTWLFLLRANGEGAHRSGSDCRATCRPSYDTSPHCHRCASTLPLSLHTPSSWGGRSRCCSAGSAAAEYPTNHKASLRSNSLRRGHFGGCTCWTHSQQPASTTQTCGLTAQPHPIQVQPAHQHVGRDSYDALPNFESLNFILFLLCSHFPPKYHFLITRWPLRPAVQEILHRFVPIHVGEGEGLGNRGRPGTR